MLIDIGIRYLVSFRIRAFSNKDREIIEERQRAIEIEDEPAALTFSLLGNELLRQGKLERATAFFKESIRLDGNDPSAYVGLGTILYKQRCIKGSLNILRMANNLYQSQPKLAEQHDEFKRIVQYILEGRRHNFFTRLLGRFLYQRYFDRSSSSIVAVLVDILAPHLLLLLQI